MRIGEALKAYRFKREIDQKSLAKEIGIPASTLCRMENGTAACDAGAFVKVLVWLTTEENRRGAA